MDGKKILNLDKMNEKVIGYINTLRAAPEKLVEILEEHLENFIDNSNYYKDVKLNRRVFTSEGKAAVLEALDFIRDKARKVLVRLEPRRGLVKSASAQVKHIISSNSISHVGPGGENMETRITTAMNSPGSCAEAIVLGECYSKRIFLNMLIDDGLKHRPHRNIMLSPDLEAFGMALEPHPTKQYIAVLHFFAEPEPSIHYRFPETPLDEEPWPENANALEKQYYQHTMGDQDFKKCKYIYSFPNSEETLVREYQL